MVLFSLALSVNDKVFCSVVSADSLAAGACVGLQHAGSSLL